MLKRLKLVTIVLVAVYCIGGLCAIVLSATLHLNEIQVGLMFILGAVFGLLCQITRIQTSEKPARVIFWPTILLNCIFFLCIIGSIYVFRNSLSNGYLPWSYFAWIVSAELAILVLLWLDKPLTQGRIFNLLLEIFILSTLLSSSFLYLFPGLWGNDQAIHVALIGNILTRGAIYGNVGQYLNYPVFHLLYVNISLITGIANLKEIQFILGIIQVLTLLWLFILVKTFFGTRAGLLSVSLVSFIPYLVVSRYQFSPSEFAVIYYIAMILSFVFMIRSKEKWAWSVIMLVIFATILFIHPMTPVFLISTLIAMMCAGWVMGYSVNESAIRQVLIMTVCTLAVWMKPYASWNIVTEPLAYLVQSIQAAFLNHGFQTIEQVTLAPIFRWQDIFLTNLGVAMFNILGVGGAFYVLKDRGGLGGLLEQRDIMRILAVAALVLLPVPYVIAIVYPKGLADRWFPFTEVLMGVFCAAGVEVIYQNKRKLFVRISILVYLVITVLFLATTPLSNPNDHLYGQEISGRSTLTMSELIAAQFIPKLQYYPVWGNSSYLALISQEYTLASNALNPDQISKHGKGWYVVRNYDLSRGFTVPLFGSQNKLLEVIVPNAMFYNFIYRCEQIYDNGAVSIYGNL